MPYRNIYRVRPRARRMRRRRRSYYVRSKKNYRRYKRSEMLTAKAPINRIANKVGFPNEIFTRLIYEDRVALSFSVAGFDTWSFAMNGLYDPDLDATGHQPRFFDQYAAVYRGYRVYAAKVMIRGFTKDTSKRDIY
jgi:hypothetical protein